MPTKNPRINITFDSEIVELLNNMATQEKKSVSSLAKELILDALDRREDMYLSSIAAQRDNNNEPRISEEDAWK